jgi:hypothetical protein
MKTSGEASKTTAKIFFILMYLLYIYILEGSVDVVTLCPKYDS